MRTIVTIICIILLLVSFVAGERIFVAKFCKDFSADILKLEEMVNSGVGSADFADSLCEKWEKQKGFTFIFANHNSFNDIESGIYNIEYSIKSQNRYDSLFFINLLYHKVNELYEATKFALGNLL